ncbi:prolyl 4-hydroxylase [Sphaerotilus hippei]|uniref:Prolyl 4-hydroxylase n=1 Tax=Sphaerotilus hippei TaxID=744406 RepID=A0A318GWE9_9BURK|nr:2OG-Fe(II) oxygenase [Sphaerotilus hippei]PXW93262.1 prolyl 4-hydroxylase [Sphaerotilus hippei]
MSRLRSTQTVTPELRQWIIDQAMAGHAPDAVLQSMLDAGWDEDVALSALEHTLQQHLEQQQLAAAQPAAPSMPEPDLAGSPSTVWAHDREVQVLMSLKQPRVVVFGGLLSEIECDRLVALAAPRLSRSETVDHHTGGSEVNEARTSRGMFFGRGEHELLQRLEARIAALVRWPVENGEGVQVLNYQPGAEYKPHYDYFDPDQPGTSTILRRGGQRVGTVVMYLNTVAHGGGTTFPDAHLEVMPVKGNAVFFSYERPHPSSRSLHGGAPVIEGEKWVATKWLRQSRFD